MNEQDIEPYSPYSSGMCLQDLHVINCLTEVWLQYHHTFESYRDESVQQSCPVYADLRLTFIYRHDKRTTIFIRHEVQHHKKLGKLAKHLSKSRQSRLTLVTSSPTRWLEPGSPGCARPPRRPLRMGIVERARHSSTSSAIWKSKRP